MCQLRGNVERVAEVPRQSLPQARPGGFEPPTYGLEVRCSIQLSYGRGVGLGWRAILTPCDTPPHVAVRGKTVSYCHCLNATVQLRAHSGG